jgi:hypothetical protein
MEGKVKELWLDIGCNERKAEGYVGLDMFPCKGVDIVINLEQEPLPFKNESVYGIRMLHTLEHLGNAWDFMFEICRVLQVGRPVLITVPFFACSTAHDLGHKMFLNPLSMSYWTEGGSVSPNNPAFLKYMETDGPNPYIKFNYFKDWKDNLLKPFEWFANRFPRLYTFGFAYLFPAFEIEYRLIKIKDYDWDNSC